MKKVIRFSSVLIIDALGVLLMIAALFTAWLPGPGGIPLFILGLSLLAINHDWAKRYIELVRKYADRAGDLIFVKDRRVELAYDIAAPVMALGGILTLAGRGPVWTLSAGLFLLGLSLVFFLGNRGRFQRLQRNLKRKR